MSISLIRATMVLDDADTFLIYVLKAVEVMRISRSKEGNFPVSFQRCGDEKLLSTVASPRNASCSKQTLRLEEGSQICPWSEHKVDGVVVRCCKVLQHLRCKALETTFLAEVCEGWVVTRSAHLNGALRVSRGEGIQQL